MVRKQIFTLGLVAFLWTPFLRASTLAFTLPDQTQVKLSAEPALEARKLSRLTLAWPKDSTWTPLAFDAEMPDHKHGMNVKAGTPTAAQGAYHIDGVKLHMPGLWILKLQVKNQAGEQRWIDQPLHLSAKTPR